MNINLTVDFLYFLLRMSDEGIRRNVSTLVFLLNFLLLIFQMLLRNNEKALIISLAGVRQKENLQIILNALWVFLKHFLVLNSISLCLNFPKFCILT